MSAALLGDLFVERCEAHASRAFVTELGRSHTYGEVLAWARRIAARVRAVAEPGARVGIMLPTGGAFVAAFFGVLLAECAVMTIDPRLAPAEVRFLAAHGELSALVAESHVPGLVVDCALLPPGAPETGAPLAFAPAGAARSLDTAVMLATSGSTSSPRIVELSHASILADVRGWNDRYSIDGADIVATPLAFCHSFGMTACMLSALDVGAEIVACTDPVPASVAALVRERRATVFVASSSFYPWLARSRAVGGEDLTSLRLAMSGACTLATSTAESFEAMVGLPIHETYGLTEASPVVTATEVGRVMRGSVGTALPGINLRVVADELHLRGETVMRGYWRNPEATARALDADGWLRTGDSASIDADGRVTILGRLKDVIVRGGEKVYPDEIEDALVTHPGVVDAAVIAAPDAVSGEIPIAFVAGAAELDAATLGAFCRSRLAAFKVPRRIEIVDAIPRNPNGKVLRRVLRERLAEGDP